MGRGLPASSENVVRYLAAYSAKLSSNTLRTHFAALAQWHITASMTQSKRRGYAMSCAAFRRCHPQSIKQAEALQLQRLGACIEGLASS